MNSYKNSGIGSAVLFCAASILGFASSSRTKADDREGASTLPPTATISGAVSSKVRRPSGRPMIGLVLGGGGSRGYAHIGIIKWLEEHRIPVDCISGTSMGGLVGGAYAAGNSPADMCRLIDGMDCDQILSGDPPYEKSSMRRKDDRRTHPSMIELGLHGGMHLPSGISPAQPIGMIISRICLPYSRISSFDELPIPFRCVATDMEAGEHVVLKDGSMGLAMRASMAFPGAFTPVELNGRLLADSVLLNVVPTDVAKEMGADVIIAVNVSTPLGERKSFTSVVGMINQSLSVTMSSNARKNMRLADVKLEPDLGNYQTTDFRECAAISKLGYDCAAQHSKELERYALSEEDWKIYLAARRERQMRFSMKPAFLEVEGAGPDTKAAIQSQLNKYCAKPLDFGRLDNDLLKISGEGRLESFSYELAHRDGQDGLLIRVNEKSKSPRFVRPSVEINNSDSGHIAFNLPARATAFDFAGYGSELRTDVCLGTRTLLAGEYFRPIGSWFLAPRAIFDRSPKGLMSNGNRIGEYTKSELGAGFDIGRTIGRQSDIRLGYEIGRISTSVNSGGPQISVPGGSFSAASLRWTYDGQNRAMVPTRGTRVETSAKWFMQSPGAGQFPMVESQLSTFKPISKEGSVFAMASGGTTFGHAAPFVQQFSLGGPLHLGAYGQNDLNGSSYALGVAGYLHKMGQLPALLGDKLYAGSWFEVGGTSNSLSTIHYRTSISAALIAETRLGPIAIGGSLGDAMKSRLFFSLGKFF